MLGMVLGNFSFVQPVLDGPSFADDVSIQVPEVPAIVHRDASQYLLPLKRLISDFVGWLYKTSEPESFGV